MTRFSPFTPLEVRVLAYALSDVGSKDKKAQAEIDKLKQEINTHIKMLKREIV